MINIQTIENVSDCVPLYLPHSLYLKPLAKFNVSVALPNNRTGKSISNLEVMEKLSAALRPDKFLVLRAIKSTLDYIRFEAELDTRKKLHVAIGRLDGSTIRISGFHDSLRVRASEAKDQFPTRHDWDSFFRDANNMDEMKPGERPDTIHLSHLPIRWFCPRQAENHDEVKPSESIFRRIFEKFGSVRCVDIPICDAFRSKMNADINGMRTFSSEQDVLFEGYVQFDEYVGFVRAMDEFRGMKLVRKFVDKTQAINVKVNFDRTKHLSEASIMRRERVRKRLSDKAKAEEERLLNLKREEEERLELERQTLREKEEALRKAELEKKRQREEVRKEKHLKKIQEQTQHLHGQKVRVEERKLKIAQRKLESIRILDAVFSRIQEKHMEELNDKPSTSSAVDPAKEQMRVRLVQKYKDATEKLVMDQRKKVQDMKSQTSLQGILQSLNTHSKDVDDEARRKKSEAPAKSPAEASNAIATAATTMNPFATMAAAASEWMESMGGMFPYMQPMMPGMAPSFRPPGYMGMRGMLPGGFRGRPRGRGYFGGRGRGNYDPNYVPHYMRHQHEDYEHEGENGGGGDPKYHYAHPGSRYPRPWRGGYPRGGNMKEYPKRHSHRHRSRSRSRSRSSSYSRSRSRSRGRSRHYSKRSRDRARSYSSRSRSRSRSRSKSHDRGGHKKLVSTRRSRSATRSSSSRSHSRSRHRSSHKHSRRSSDRSSARHSRKVAQETNEFLRTAEVIQTTIAKDLQNRMREEEREIKQQFRNSAYMGEQQMIARNNHTSSPARKTNPFANGQHNNEKPHKIDDELRGQVERSRSRSRVRLYDDEELAEADERHAEETKRRRTTTRSISRERGTAE